MHTHMHAHTHSHTHTHAHTHTHSRTGLGVEDKVDLDTAIRSARSFYDLALERGGMDVVAPVFLASQYLSLVNASAHYCSQELTDMLLSLSRPWLHCSQHWTPDIYASGTEKRVSWKAKAYVKYDFFRETRFSVPDTGFSSPVQHETPGSFDCLVSKTGFSWRTNHLKEASCLHESRFSRFAVNVIQCHSMHNLNAIQCNSMQLNVTHIAVCSWMQFNIVQLDQRAGT